MTATAFFGVNKLLPRIYVLYICRRGDVPCKVGAASVQGREMKGTPFPRARRFERCHKQDTLSHVGFCFASFSSKRTRSPFQGKDKTPHAKSNNSKKESAAQFPGRYVSHNQHLGGRYGIVPQQLWTSRPSQDLGRSPLGSSSIFVFTRKPVA